MLQYISASKDPLFAYTWLLQTEALIKGWGLGGEINIFHFFINMYMLIRVGSEVIFPDIIYLSTFSITLECHLPFVTFNAYDHDL